MLYPTAPLDRARQAFSENDPASTDRALGEAHAAASTNEERIQVALLSHQLGRLDLARAIYRESAMEHGDLAALDSLVDMQTDHDALDVGRLQRQFASPDARVRAVLGFALGKIFHDRRDPDRAFQYYAAGNQAMKAITKRPPHGSDKTLSFVRQYFTPAIFSRYAGGGYAPARPIFIVGMPRSGSTLTEQIISSHPDVYAGGEMPLINRVLGSVTNNFKIPERRLLTNSKLTAFTTMGKIYWDAVERTIGTYSHITDKYLNNIWAIGYIKLMFPNAKVIHVVRDPLDNGFAIFRRKFSSVPFGYDLTDIGMELRRQQEVAQYWDKLLPGFVYRLKYEDLVLDFEPQVRRLIAHCELDWNDACLEFHRNTRGVRTNSVTQVRQPLFTGGIGSAEPYRPFMGDFFKALAG